MIFYTAHMRDACRKLNITDQDLADIPQPTHHMCMAHALADELSRVTYEQAEELLWPMDGELCVDVCEHWRLLRLAPGVCETPGNGLPTIEEQMKTLQRETELSMERGRQQQMAQLQGLIEMLAAKEERSEAEEGQLADARAQLSELQVKETASL